MFICDPGFHAALLRQSSGREKRYLRNRKNTVRRMFTLRFEYSNLQRTTHKLMFKDIQWRTLKIVYWNS